MNDQQVKVPPLGLIPKQNWDQKRCDDIIAAIKRYQDAGKSIPQEWMIELCSLEHCLRFEIQIAVKVGSSHD